MLCFLFIPLLYSTILKHTIIDVWCHLVSHQFGTTVIKRRCKQLEKNVRNFASFQDYLSWCASQKLFLSPKLTSSNYFFCLNCSGFYYINIPQKIYYVLQNHTVKSRVKENLLSVEYRSSFVPFLSFQGWICSITFSIKAFQLFANCGTLVRFIVSASFFLGNALHEISCIFCSHSPKKDNIYWWLIYCWVQLGLK